MKKNILVGGKLGDFIHALYVVKCLSAELKSDVYISPYGDMFSYGLVGTYNDIYNVIKHQPYIDNFLLYTGGDINDFINTSNFFKSDLLYKATWYEIYQKCNNIVENKFENEPWLTGLDIKEYDIYKDKVIIHFSEARSDNTYDELLLNIIKNNDCIFISNRDSEYENFKFKNLLPFKKCNGFTEIFSIIEKCKFFVGNQSMPLAVAHGLFKSHLGFLYSVNEIYLDALHYKDNFNKNYFWFDNQGNISENFDDIKNFISLK
jgi:hypothetical protein